MTIEQIKFKSNHQHEELMVLSDDEDVYVIYFLPDDYKERYKVEHLGRIKPLSLFIKDKSRDAIEIFINRIESGSFALVRIK